MYWQHGFCWCLSPSIPIGKSSIWLSKSTQSWWIWVFAGRPTLVCPWVGIRSQTLLMSLSFTSSTHHRGRPCGVVFNLLNGNIIVSSNSSHTIMFTFGRILGGGKVWTLLHSFSYVLQGWLWHYITHKGWYAIKQKKWPVCLSWTVYEMGGK